MSKLLLTGDWHLDIKEPKSRKGNYFKAMVYKMKWIFELALKCKVEAILQPGDLFNYHDMPDSVKTYWIKFFRHYNIKILTVPGQHDMRYHTSPLKNTPMGVLEAADPLTVLGEDPYTITPTFIYGAGWNQDIPTIKTSAGTREITNILVTHRMVATSPEWPGHKYSDTGKLLETTNFDLIVCGDNHKSFITRNESKNRYVINCGSLMRSKIDQINHRPCVYVYETKNKSIQKYKIPIKSFKDVMDLEELRSEKEKNEELEALIDGLSDTNIEGLEFKKNMIEYLQENKGKVTQGTVDIINEMVE
jgi:DNA repair exonuclease SbcCD nuclease subunit